jgi:hypothetical protein
MAAFGQAFSQDAVTVAIDVNVTGNSARSVGTIEDCARIDTAVSKKLQIDVVIPDPGIPADVGIKGWQFDLLYDPNVVHVVDHDPNMLLAQAEGSDLLTSLSEETPDSDGSFTSAAVDFTRRYQIEPNGAQEIGPGVIARITLEAVGKGATNLTFGDNLALLGENGAAIPIGKVQEAAVSVDTNCVPPPARTPTSTPTPAGGTTGGTATATAAPGTPETGAASPTDGGTAAGQTPAQTPGPGTPVPGGSPVSGENGGATNASETNGNGLSTGAWIGIGFGIAAVALAASGAGWFALRKRRGGGSPTTGGKTGSE